jgi:hypothetical protein
MNWGGMSNQLAMRPRGRPVGVLHRRIPAGTSGKEEDRNERASKLNPERLEQSEQMRETKELENTVPQSSVWQDEVTRVAIKWPRGFRARKENGYWRLMGANHAVLAEFERYAERIARELGFPRGDGSPTTNLLEHLKNWGAYVRVSSPFKVSKRGSTKSTTRNERVSIYPLSSAVVAYLSHKGGKPPVKSRTISGQVAAVKGDRANHERASIVRALEKMGPDFAKRWPDFVVDFSRNRNQHSEYQQPVWPGCFQPPAFDRLNQSPAEWKRIADRAWEEHRDGFLKECQFWETAGLDEEIPPAKRMRGPRATIGRGKRRNNSVVELRHAWAAKRLLGFRIKEIAAHDGADPSTVGRIARQILRQANWTTPAKSQG